MMTNGSHQEQTETHLALLSAVMEQEERVSRTEALLTAARRRLLELQRRLGQVTPAFDDSAVSVGPEAGRRAPRVDDGQPSMRARIVARIEASPTEVWTPALLAPLVGAVSRDSVRNSLLALAAQGRIDKVGPGQYRACTATVARARRPKRSQVTAHSASM